MVETWGSICIERCVVFVHPWLCDFKIIVGSCSLDYRLVQVPGSLLKTDSPIFASNPFKSAPFVYINSLSNRISLMAFFSLRYLGYSFLHPLGLRPRIHPLQHNSIMPSARPLPPCSQDHDQLRTKTRRRRIRLVPWCPSR